MKPTPRSCVLAVAETGPIPAISLLQPWASLVANGRKVYETRGWATRHRGLLAIHASARMTAETVALRDLWAEDLGIRPGGDLPLGCVVAVCTLTDCLPTQHLAGLALPGRHFGDFTHGRFAWRLADVQRLDTPVPARGRLGLWPWTPPERFRGGISASVVVGRSDLAHPTSIPTS